MLEIEASKLKWTLKAMAREAAEVIQSSEKIVHSFSTTDSENTRCIGAASAKAAEFVEEADEFLEWLKADNAAFEVQVADARKQIDAISPADFHEDAPIKLEDALYLPELGGYFAESREMRRRSESITLTTLRQAIKDGRLQKHGPNKKNFYVTRRMIRDWMDTWHDQDSLLTLSSDRPAQTPRARSPTPPFGSSKMESTERALDAARLIMSELKNNSKATSRKNKP